MKNIKYEYKNCPIPGGGYVTGFLFDQNQKDVMYIRTDIGGTYRHNRETELFEALNDDVNMKDLAPTYVAGLAIDANTPGSLYIACGLDRVDYGELLVSKDYGKTFVKKNMPAMAHGNKNGRGTGKRLIVDENGTIYFASYEDGLLITRDEGETWEKIKVNGEGHLTFVFKKPDSATIVVGTSGVDTKINEKLRGHSLYISYDDGASFEKVIQPETGIMEKSRMSGLVGHRYAFLDDALYITANHTGERAYIVEPGYSCDCGQVLGGMVLKYTFDKEGKISAPENIAPEKDFASLDYGYGGIDFSKNTPGLFVLSTITRNEGDIIYRSYDYGKTWEKVLEGLSVGKIEFKTSYMKPEHNGGGSLIHWLTDIVFNPFNDDEVWFNSGTGVFRTDNFTSDCPVFHDSTDGIEETVHLNVYAPVSGDVKLIDIVGDLGGFAFRDLNKACKNSFDDENGNRYITCINADFSDTNPDVVVATARGNWTGKTKGGLILSKDNCKTWERLSLPYGLSENLDEHFRGIENPNTNAGWVAVSSDAKTFVWSVAEFIRLPKDLVIVSKDAGRTWSKVSINQKGADDKFFKVFADRVDSNLFFGFSENGNIYISNDGALTFERCEELTELAGVDFGLIDCANKTEVRGEAGKRGVFYIAAGAKGLWKLEDMKLKKLSKDGDVVYRMGLGINKGSTDYVKDNKAIYVCAEIDGEYGFYRSFDEFETVERINTDSQMFGDVNSLDADKREFGRFFIASGSRGVLYGEEAKA